MSLQVFKPAEEPLAAGALEALRLRGPWPVPVMDDDMIEDISRRHGAWNYCYRIYYKNISRTNADSSAHENHLNAKRRGSSLEWVGLGRPIGLLVCARARTGAKQGIGLSHDPPIVFPSKR